MYVHASSTDGASLWVSFVIYHEEYSTYLLIIARPLSKKNNSKAEKYNMTYSRVKLVLPKSNSFVLIQFSTKTKKLIKLSQR